MLQRKELLFYITIIFTFLVGVFIFVPAVAVENKDNIKGRQSSGGAESVSTYLSDEDGGTGINEIMKALEARERDLSKREEALNKEEERLNMLQKSVELSLRQYTSLRDRIQKSSSESMPKDGVSRMARLYEAMSVEEAAQRIEKMDMDLAVKLLTAIKSKQAGKILGAINADRAALISARLAVRKADR